MNLVPSYRSEQDVDTYIHTSFRRSKVDIKKQYNIKICEMFFNPPGGNWSSIKLLSNNNKHLWEHIKREEQRPDIIWAIEIQDRFNLLVIESKENYNDHLNVSHSFLYDYGKLLIDTPSTNDGFIISSNYRTIEILTGFICSKKKGYSSTNKFDIELHIDWDKNTLNQFLKSQVNEDIRNVLNRMFNS